MPDKTVAVYGGSFDPPTMAHEAVAAGLLGAAELKVDEVWLMPCFDHSFGKDMTDFKEHMAMCSLTAHADTRISATDYEVKVADRWSCWDNGSTMKTAFKLAEDFEGTGFMFVIGMDCALEFSKWKHYEELQQFATFIVVPREGYSHDPAAWYMRGTQPRRDGTGKHIGWAPRHHYLPGLQAAGMSSTGARKALREWTDRSKDPPALLKEMLDPVVLSYIAEKGLYTK